MCSVTKPSVEYNKLIEEYKKLHEDPTIFPGKSITKYAHYVRSIIRDNKCKTLLDYGCGKGGLYEEENKNKLINSIIKFEFIESTKSKKIDQNDPDLILELLAIDIFKKNFKYEIILLFSNNKIINLNAEVIEITLEDQIKIND